jgi:hypothetical protein
MLCMNVQKKTRLCKLGAVCYVVKKQRRGNLLAGLVLATSVVRLSCRDFKSVVGCFVLLARRGLLFYCHSDSIFAKVQCSVLVRTVVC